LIRRATKKGLKLNSLSPLSFLVAREGIELPLRWFTEYHSGSLFP
jgi:hypothetical protein